MARELVETFDELLKGNRQELEALYNRPSDGSKGAVSAGENDSDTPPHEHGNIKQFDNQCGKIDSSASLYGYTHLQ